MSFPTKVAAAVPLKYSFKLKSHGEGIESKKESIEVK
jgi:hypothetical protein